MPTPSQLGQLSQPRKCRVVALGGRQPGFLRDGVKWSPHSDSPHSHTPHAHPHLLSAPPPPHAPHPPTHPPISPPPHTPHFDFNECQFFWHSNHFRGRFFWRRFLIYFGFPPRLGGADRPRTKMTSFFSAQGRHKCDFVYKIF